MSVYRRMSPAANLAALREAAGWLQCAYVVMQPRVAGADARTLTQRVGELRENLVDLYGLLGAEGLGRDASGPAPWLRVTPPPDGDPAAYDPARALWRCEVRMLRVALNAVADPRRSRGNRQRLGWNAARTRDGIKRARRFAGRLIVDPRQQGLAGVLPSGDDDGGVIVGEAAPEPQAAAHE